MMDEDQMKKPIKSINSWKNKMFPVDRNKISSDDYRDRDPADLARQLSNQAIAKLQTTHQN
jgi:hypothetical protein